MFNAYFTKRSVLLGSVLSMFVALSSVYLALRQNAFYWASVLTSLLAASLLMLLSKVFSPTNRHEVNITQAAASTGGILAAGVCFFVPALFFIDQTSFVSLTQNTWRFVVTILILSLIGGICGVIFSAYLRHHMIEEEKLPFPTGVAAADTIKAVEKGGRQLMSLLLSFLGVSFFTVFRDGLEFGRIKLKGLIPYFQDMSQPPFTLQWGYVPAFVGAGYLMGWRTVLMWGLGAVCSNFFYVPLLFFAFHVPFDAKWPYVLSLGVGTVIGGSAALFFTKIGPSMIKTFRAALNFTERKDEMRTRWVPIAGVAAALAVSIIFNLNFFTSILLVLGMWIMSAFAARMSGEVNVDPMEIFAVLVLMLIRVFVHLDTLQMIYVGTIVCVAVGVAGDTLFDLKAAHILGTRPIDITKAQIVGVVFSSLVVGFAMLALLKAFVLGSSDLFALQAQSVAFMLNGIKGHLFFIGFLIGIALTFLRRSGVAFGVGFFIPLFLTVPFIIGGVWNYVSRNKTNDEFERIISAGAIGGEGFVGAVLAIIKQGGQLWSS